MQDISTGRLHEVDIDLRGPFPIEFHKNYSQHLDQLRNVSGVTLAYEPVSGWLIK